MLSALTANMQDIFGFFSTELYTHTELYKSELQVCLMWCFVLVVFLFSFCFDENLELLFVSATGG